MTARLLDPATLTDAIKSDAARLGFTLLGACPAVEPDGFTRFEQWLAAGYAGTMHYLEARLAAYAHPRHVLAGARSLLVLAFPYRTVEPEAPQPGRGRVSRYAWGLDYHDLLWAKLGELEQSVRRLAPEARLRTVVDTAPLLEREFAELAGLGWIGKNTLLLNKQQGSWFFLAALLTDLELEYDARQATDHCGTCRACLDACPTGAFVDAYVLDARRCISYLTIEHQGPIPRELRSGVGDWLFGCDVCQDVCPWNHKAPVSQEPAFQPLGGLTALELAEWFTLDDAAFRQRFRRTPLWRPKRRGLLRNAAIVLGNQRSVGALPALIRGLHDVEPLVRGACAWALGQYQSDAARAELQRRQAIENDPDVLAEITGAIAISG